MEEYLRPAFEELYREDGLLVMAKGLGIWELFMKFVALYCKQPGESAGAVVRSVVERKLVFCLNSMERSDEIKKSLIYEGLSPTEFPKVSMRFTGVKVADL
jgi:hypothetical protein